MKVYQGTAAERAASEKVGDGAALVVEEDTGHLAVGDGTTPLSDLQRLARVDEVPGLVPAASTAAAGKVELATTDETTTGTDTSRAVTPAGLKAVVDAIVNAAPGTLDTLKELADALGDDPNFAATVTASIAAKIPTTQKGAASGVAALDAGQKLLEANVPDRLSDSSLSASYVGKAPAAVGNATTDAAALTGALAADDVVHAQGGTYVLGRFGISLTEGKTLEIPTGSMLKLDDDVLQAAATTQRALRMYSNTKFVGRIDGNRDEQDKAAFNTAGGEAVGIYNTGICVLGTEADPVEDIHIDARVENVVDTPVKLEWVNDAYVRLRGRFNGGAASFSDCDDIELDVVVIANDNDGWKIFPHAVDLTRCTGRGRVIIIGQKGIGTVAGGTALSDYFSGLTMIDCPNFQWELIDAEAEDTSGQVLGVGVSIVGQRNIEIQNLRIAGYSDVLLELGGVVGGMICNYDLDGRYAVNGAGTSTGRGIAAYNNAIRGDFKGRTWEFTRDLKFVNGQVRRCRGHAVDLWAAKDTSWFGGSFTASLIGLYAKITYDASVTPEGVARASGAVLTGHTFVACSFDYNENSGVELWDGSDLLFSGCRANNNGQARTYGSTRNGSTVDATAGGFVMKTSTTKTGLRWIEPIADDTQSFTAPGYLVPTDGHTIAVNRVELYAVGQTISIAGAGAAGAALVTQINEITHDELTISDPVVTFPTVAGTGTISTTGTLVTGVGTNFDPEFDGRLYIKVGSESRRGAKVVSDTQARLDSAFSVDVSAGSSFSFYKATVSGLPSQVYGMVVNNDTTSPCIIGTRAFVGNVTGAISDTLFRLRTVGMAGQTSWFTNSVRSDANLQAQVASGAADILGAVGPSSKRAVQLAGQNALYRDSSNVFRSAGKLTADAGLGVGNSAAATTPGSVVKKMEVFDAAGTSLGFVPIYSTIT